MKKVGLFIIALATAICANATDLKDLKIYVNPGHGGHDSDDRNVAVPPFASGDPEGFWESNSNLIKGLDLRDMLKSFGADVMMSRTTNTTADDRGLTEIGLEANAYGADFFFSIHSNAQPADARHVNQPLMLYRGFNNDPVFPEAKVMSEILNKQLLENRVTSWSSESLWLAGDYDFYNWGVGVGLGVLRKLQVPGMLSEGSHHDYIPETYRLLNKDYCWLEAYHFVKSVMEYFKASETFSKGVVTGMVRDSRLVRTESIYDVFYGHDKAKPICGAVVELVDNAGTVVESYTTDQYFNGMFMFKNVNPGEYKLVVKHPEYRPFEESITVTANTVTYNNPVVDRIRNTAPEVTEYSPIWKEGDQAVVCNEPIRITFNWDMDTESVEKAFSITPAVEGTITWEESQYVLVFTPKKVYDTNTVYTVKIDKSAKHPENIAMGKDFSFTFKTADYNTYEIVAANPAENSKVHYQKPTVHFIFPSHPNTSFIQDEITVTDESGAKLSYNVRSKKFSKATDDFGFFQIKLSKDLTAGKTYYVNVAETVRDAFDIPIAQASKYAFTAVDASVDNESFTMLEAFDATGLLVKNTDKQVNVASTSVALDMTNKLEGVGCWKMFYKFSGIDKAGKAYYNYAGASVVDGNKDANLRVYGDMSMNELKIVVTSEDGSNEKELPLCKLDFFGWQTVTIPAGTMSGNYKIKHFVVDKEAGNKYGLTGNVYVDKLSSGISEGGVEAIETESVRVYPNPASELLIANADKTILGMELVTLDGKTVSAVSGNVMNVTSVAEGMYIVKIFTQNGYGVKKVAVKH